MHHQQQRRPPAVHCCSTPEETSAALRIVQAPGLMSRIMQRIHANIHSPPFPPDTAASLIQGDTRKRGASSTPAAISRRLVMLGAALAQPDARPSQLSDEMLASDVESIAQLPPVWRPLSPEPPFPGETDADGLVLGSQMELLPSSSPGLTRNAPTMSISTSTAATAALPVLSAPADTGAPHGNRNTREKRLYSDAFAWAEELEDGGGGSKNMGSSPVASARQPKAALARTLAPETPPSAAHPPRKKFNASTASFSSVLGRLIADEEAEATASTSATAVAAATEAASAVSPSTGAAQPMALDPSATFNEQFPMLVSSAPSVSSQRQTAEHQPHGSASQQSGFSVADSGLLFDPSWSNVQPSQPLDMGSLSPNTHHHPPQQPSQQPSQTQSQARSLRNLRTALRERHAHTPATFPSDLGSVLVGPSSSPELQPLAIGHGSAAAASGDSQPSRTGLGVLELSGSFRHEMAISSLIQTTLKSLPSTGRSRK